MSWTIKMVLYSCQESSLADICGKLGLLGSYTSKAKFVFLHFSQRVIVVNDDAATLLNICIMIKLSYIPHHLKVLKKHVCIVSNFYFQWFLKASVTSSDVIFSFCIIAFIFGSREIYVLSFIS